VYRVFDHTADLGLHIEAATQEELFAEAGRALVSVIIGDINTVNAVEAVDIRLEGDDPIYLLFDWLNELLYLFESRRLVLSQFDVTLTPTGLAADARGEPFDPDRHGVGTEVKAITYHHLAVSETPQGWVAEVIVDI
jgi:SHS2 domain-containing protein